MVVTMVDTGDGDGRQIVGGQWRKNNKKKEKK